MRCSELNFGLAVVFKTYSDILKRKYYEVGTVLHVDMDRGKVWVSWLDGYKDRRKPIPFKDMVAAYNENGEYMKFENVSGNSILLTAN